MNRIARRMVSAPKGSMTLEGGTTLPSGLGHDIAASSFTMPWHNRLVKGSSTSSNPISRSALVKRL